MWIADYYEDGEWKPLMNQLSGKRSHEPTEQLMRDKIEVLVKLMKHKVGKFRVFRREDGDGS